MDSDVEMVDPPTLRPASPATPHVSPAPSTPHSVLDDLQDYGSPEKQPDVPDADPDEEHEPDVADNDEHDNADNADNDDDPLPPPTTNEDDPDAPMSPLGPDGEEPDDDASESENSSDDASEDDVDKDLIPTAADISDVDPDVIVVDGAPDAIRIPVLVQTPPLDTAAPTSPLSAPPTSAAKPPPPAPIQKKPKSHHAPPPPPPPPPPAPMQTIRLEIRLGGPENYEIDVKGKARDEGFVWGEPDGKKYADEESSDEGSDGEDGEGKDDGKDKDGDVEMDADGKPKKPKPKPKKKSKSKSKAAAEYYDTTDPFIDDSELAIDERTYFAQTKQKGFYVSSGEVALVRDKSPKKPKSKKKVGPSLALTMPTASTSALKPASTAVKKSKSAGTTSKAPTSKAPTSKAATAAAAKALGTKESPIPLEDEDEDKADVFGGGGAPRRASASASATGGKGKGKGKERAGDGDDDAEVNGNGMSSTRSPNGVGVNGNGVNGDYPNGKEEMSGDGEDGEGGGGEDEVGKKRKRAGAGAGAGTNGVGGGEGVKKRKVVDIESFHPDLQTSIEKMKQAIAAESWETKSKFPPNLKPLLAALSLQAITLDQYDDQFFNLMPLIFPYNKFTMSKLIKRTIFHDHTALLNQRQDDLLEQLKVLAQEGFPKAQEEWERSLQNYEEKRKEKAARADGDPAAGESGVEGSTAPTRHGTEDPEARLGSAGLSSAGDGEKDKGKGDNDKEGPGKGGAHHGPPLKKYRMGESMKVIVWQLVLLSNEICRLENEKNSLEGSVLQVSEQGLRKVLYQRIVSAFPEGWMSSGQISRDVSAMKKKYEKEAQDD